MTGYQRDGLWTIFLAAIMVLSVVTVTTAFAGSAAAQQSGDEITVENLSDLETNITGSGDAGTGDTVVVEEGSYNSDGLSVGVENLTIRSAEGHNPEVNISNNNQFTINTDGVTVQGLSISRPDDGNSLLSAKGDSPTIVENKLEGGPLAIGGSADITLVNNTLIGTNPADGHGIFLTSAAGDVTVEHNNLSEWQAPNNEFADLYIISEITSLNGQDVMRAGALDVQLDNTDLNSTHLEFAKLSTVKPGDTVLDAIDRASSDYTIFVEPGTYDGAFDIPSKNLTVESTAGADDTTLDLGTDRINIGANNIAIDGFSFVFESQAIYEAGNENVTIQNNDFELAEGTESQGYAIRFEGSSSGGVARNNEFVGIDNTVQGEYGNGIVVAGADGHEIVGNTFTNNSIGLNVGGQQPAGALKVANNNFTQQDNWAIALNHDDSESPDFNISGNQIESNEVGILVLATGSININENNIVDSGFDASALSEDTVNATSNWWGATDGPSGSDGSGYDGHGASVSGNVNADDWITVNSGDPSVDHDFVGIVTDDNGATVTGDGFDLEAGLGLANGTLVFEVGDTNFTATMTNGKVVEGQTFDSTAITSDIETGTVGVEVVSGLGEDGYASVGTTDEVTLVHEAFAAGIEGWFLTSMPMAGDLHTSSGISDVTQYDGNTGEFADFDDSDESSSVNRALMINADTSDTRYGFDFDTDRSDQLVNAETVGLEEGWHVLGSNYNISDKSGYGLIDDLDTQAAPSSTSLNVYDRGVTTKHGDSHSVGEYETYYVFVHDGDVRPVRYPAYNPNPAS